MTQDSGFRLLTIGQISIHRVRTWTGQLPSIAINCGMQFLLRVPNMAFFDCSGVRLMSEYPRRSSLPDIQSSILYYLFDGIHDAYRVLKDRNVPFDGVPHKIADLQDHELRNWLWHFGIAR